MFRSAAPVDAVTATVRESPPLSFVSACTMRSGKKLLPQPPGPVKSRLSRCIASASAFDRRSVASNEERFKTFVGSLQAYGGEDACEDVANGLAALSSLPWTPSSTKLLVHIADAPCHGDAYHSPHVDDDHPQLGDDIPPLVRWVRDTKIAYVFGRISPHTDQMVAAFSELLKPRDKVHQIELSNLDNFVSLLSQTISATITLVATAQEESARVQRSYRLVSAPPHWPDVPAERATVYWFKEPEPNVALADAIAGRGRMSLSTRVATFKLAPHPFAEGASRIVYHLQELGDRGARCVAKESKWQTDKTSKDDLVREMEIQALACGLASQFNVAVKAARLQLPVVKFLTARMLCFDQRRVPRYFNYEKHMVDGAAFEKFNNNWGWADARDSELAGLIGAFSHFTHHASGGVMIVVDIQGIRRRDAGGELILTDPAAHHTNESRFGRTNLGSAGIGQFFATHSCGAVCKALRLSAPAAHDPRT